ncbi:MAG: pectinesterase family protein, partial [Prevotella sp.]
FNDCDLTAENGASDCYLARPWADTDCGTVYMNTRIGSHINPLGWGGNGNTSNMSFAEYNSMNSDGTPADMTGRASWGTVLTAEDMSLLDLTAIYNMEGKEEFSPEEAVVGVMPPTNIVNDNGFVTWDAVSGARGYVVYLNGTIVGFTDGNAYYDPAASEGTYSVRAIAANGALSQLNDTEYNLTVESLHKALNPYSNTGGETEKEEVTITATASPAEGGTVSPTSVTCMQGESVTLTATAAEGYKFKNWTTENGRVYSTDATYTFDADVNVDLIANFSLLPKEKSHHVPQISAYEYEYIDATLIPEQQPNATTGALEWCIKHEYTNWVLPNPTTMNVSGRQVEIDPITDEVVPYYIFSTNNMIRVGTQKQLSLLVTGTKKAKIYFNGAASTPGHIVIDIKPEGESTTTINSTNDYGKLTNHQSDTIETELDPSKKYELLLRGTQDMALWAFKFWPSSDGIDEIEADNEDNAPIYNIQGLKVKTTVPGNIYIRNGKKFVKPF